MKEDNTTVYERVGFYLIKEKIGIGAFSKVFYGYDTRSLKKVAIKVMNMVEIGKNLQIKKGIENQIRALSLIQNSPHVIKLFENFRTRQHKFLVYELCPEGSLQEIISRHTHLTEDQAKNYLKQIILGYKQLFINHIVHRDLKPQNLLVKKGKIKIADFGLCHVLPLGSQTMKSMVGTLCYQAPQIIRGDSYTSKCDVYSLGVIFYKMLYGRCPFQLQCQIETLTELDSRQLIFPSQFSVSQQSKYQIKKMLEIKQNNRLTWPKLFQIFLQEPQSNYIPKIILPNKSRISTEATETTINSPKTTLTIDKILLLHEQILNVIDIMVRARRYFPQNQFYEIMVVCLSRVRRQLDSLIQEVECSMGFEVIQKLLKDNFQLLQALIKLLPVKLTKKPRQAHSVMHITLTNFISRLLNNPNKISREPLQLAAALIDIQKKRYILSRQIYTNLSENQLIRRMQNFL